MFKIHMAGGLGALVLAGACLRSLYRKRLEHQGIGIPAILAGMGWCGVALTTGYSGTLLVGHGSAPALLVAPAQPKPAPAAVVPMPVTTPALSGQDPEATSPVRALDFGRLQATAPEPVKSAAHGNRWIRVWLSPGAAQAYQAGTPLPPGTLAVLSTVEDRWGRPGYELGPLYALEIGAQGQPKLTFYWPEVPEAHRGETFGAQRAYWRQDDPGLKACMACHAQGAAPLKDRSRLGLPRKPKAAASPAADSHQEFR